MLEAFGNIWDFHNQGEWIGVTTNQVIKSNGQAVMGKGIALEAANRFPELPSRLARCLKQGGNYPYIFPMYKIVTIPTKNHWRDKSDLNLIIKSCNNLNFYTDEFNRLYIPRLGCGCGGLKWQTVKQAISSILDDRFIVASPL